MYLLPGEQDADGKEVSFDKFKGKVVLGCNVASKCGYTASNYKVLEEDLYSYLFNT